MLTRSIRSMVTFANSFTLGNSDIAFPPGAYEVIFEEELLQGLSFEAYRRTATYLIVRGRGSQAGQTTMHKTTQTDLEQAITCDQARSDLTQDSEAALSPLEDLK